MKTELVALKGKLYTKSFQLAEGQKVTLGRGADVDIQILDHGLSRHHCAFEKRGDTFVLSDCGSRNGTWVNEQQVTEQTLQAGDVIRIGGIEFEFRCGPDRRRTNADLIAAVPERPQGAIAERLNVDASDLMELSAPFESMENYRRVQRELATIYQVGNLISAEMNVQRMYERILEAILSVVHADRGVLLIAGADGRPTPAAQRQRDPQAPPAEAAFSNTIAEECFRDRTCILRSNVLQDERYNRAESILAQNIHSVLCAPIEAAGQVIGALYADTMSDSETFQKHDLELLAAVGKQAGVAIHRARLSEQLSRMLRGTVRALAAAIEAKDDYTRGHSERVTAYALRAGALLSLTPEQLLALELAGFLHDVGKIGVPESILRKAGPLTEEEYRIVQQHPIIGAGIIRNIEGAEDIAEIVRHHHERWDGKGYPDGLSQDQTSLPARVLAVADAFDAMSSQRPYRDRLAQEKVMRTLREMSGRQFDPKVVACFLKTLEEEETSESRRSLARSSAAEPTRQAPPP